MVASGRCQEEALKNDTKKVGQKRARRRTGPLRGGCGEAASMGWARPSGTPISNDYSIPLMIRNNDYSILFGD